MNVDTGPRTEIVYLEPKERAALDVEREALISEIDQRLQTDIATPDEYRIVADIESRVSQYLDRVEPQFDDHCRAAYRVWKSACDIRERFLSVPKAMKDRARRLLSEFKSREETARRDEEIRIAKEQFDAAVERQRAEARLLKDQNQPEMAAALLQTPVDAPAVSLPSTVPQVDGLSYREDWYWQPVGGDTPANRIRALSMLVKPEYLPFVALHDAGLTAFARRTKGTIKVPGITFGKKQIPVRR